MKTKISPELRWAKRKAAVARKHDDRQVSSSAKNGKHATPLQEAIALNERTLQEAAARAGVEEITTLPAKAQREIAHGAGYRQVAVKLIDRSPLNREEFDAEKLNEMIASVREHGIIQPLILRPKGDGRFEIVIGERRWRAAKAAGLAEVPVIVKILSDREAQEERLTENLQREDLRPMDEARGYKDLMGLGYKIDDLVKKLNRSKSSIYGRLKLLELPAAARKACETGKLPASHAELITRIDNADIQAQFTARILKPTRWEADESGILSFRATKQLAEMMKKKAKAAADYEIAKAEFEKKGFCVLTPAELKKVMPHGWCQGDEYVENLEYGTSAGESWAKMLRKDQRPSPILGRDSEGAPKRIYKRDELQRAAEKLGNVFKKEHGHGGNGRNTYAEEHARQKRAHARRMIVFEILVEKIALAAAGHDMSSELFQLLLASQVNAMGYDCRKLLDRWGLKSKGDERSAVLKHAATFQQKQLRQLLAELAFRDFESVAESAGVWKGEEVSKAMKGVTTITAPPPG